MFFGLDYSHAPPQSLYERQKGKVVANPTIVGVRIMAKNTIENKINLKMAYTIGKQMLAMRGTYWWANLNLKLKINN